MKRVLLRLLLPSAKAIAKWERTRQRGLIRFTVVVGISWLLLTGALMSLFELVSPIGFFARITRAFSERPFEATGILLGTSMAFGLMLFLVNEVLYRIARGRTEP